MYFVAPPDLRAGVEGKPQFLEVKFECSNCLHPCALALRLLEISGSPRTLCVLTYRPPKYNKAFIYEFADLLESLFLNYDCVLITGEGDPLAKDFLALIDSFNFTQWVNEPTHIQCHTLDLVFSYALDIRDISNAGISDHLPVKFDADLSNAELVRIIDSGTVANFSAAFINSALLDAD